MNDPQDHSDEIAPPVNDAADAGSPAPKRRRAPRTASTVADEAVAVPAIEGVAPAAPKRRVRKAAEAPLAPAADVAAEATTEEAADKPARARRTGRLAVSAPAAQATLALEDSPVLQPADTLPPVTPPTSESLPAPQIQLSSIGADVAEPVAAQGGEQGGDEAQAGAGAPEGRERGRRRDRRERRDRGEATAQVSDDAGNADAGRFVAPPMAPVADAAACFEAVVSGQYDAEAPEADEAPADETAEQTEDSGKRVLRPEPEAPKLHKVLAAAGIGSRRDMEALIEEGQVTVNGEVAHQGMRITHGDQIRVSGRPVKVRIAPPPARVLAYHKPVGEVVTHNDPEGRPTVFKRLPRLQQGKWLSVGRLDLNTEGLLLFTNSGELANQLMHPRFGVEREYAVRVLGDLDPGLKAQLLEGVEIEGQKAAFKAIEDGGGEGANHWWRVVITEGRNREVRKLFDAVGLTVSRLIRIRYGTVVLPRGLKRGVWVELDDNDVRLIRRLAGGDARRQGQPGQPGQGQQAGRGGQPGQGQGQPQGQGKGGKHNKQQRGRNGQPLQGGGQPRGPQQGPYGNQPPRGPRPEQGGMPRQAQPYDDDREPDDPPFIPNPLEQTFDRRFATGSKRIVAGFGRPSDPSRDGPAPRVKGEPRQPDPMQTSVGYIGADAYFRKPGGSGGGGGGGGGNKRGRRR